MDLISVNITHGSLIRGSFPVTVTLECTRKKDGEHFHDFTQLWYVLSGTLKQYTTTSEYTQTPGSLFVVPPYTIHNIDTSESDDTPVYVSISFTDNFLNDHGYRYFSFTQPNVRFEGHEVSSFSELSGTKREIADMLARRMHTEFSKHFDMDYDVIRELLVEFLKLFCSSETKEDDVTLSKERADAIGKAVDYISKNFSSKITIDELCHISAMSRRIFTKSFKLITGRTVVEFITGLRIARARYYILFTNKSCSEIAELCGFCDKAHLSRVFTKHLSLSPTEYREEQLPHALALDEEQAKRWSWLRDSRK